MSRGLYVKLSVDYMTEPEMITAGALAELLYVRTLCFCKRTMRDGCITDAQLVIIGAGIRQVTKHADALVREGLWERVDGGYRVRSWLKWNRSAAEIEEEAQLVRDAAELGNHRRWHEGEDGKPSPKCRYCRETRSGRGSGTRSGGGSGDPKRGRSPEKETETETEEETEEETETDMSDPSTWLQGAGLEPVDKPKGRNINGRDIDWTVAQLSRRHRA